MLINCVYKAMYSYFTVAVNLDISIELIYWTIGNLATMITRYVLHKFYTLSTAGSILITVNGVKKNVLESVG